MGLLFLLVFLLGLVVGSFLNVVILRLNTGFGIGGRSQCFSCGRTLSWFELVPLLSFLFLRGRCKGCKSRISLQYFFVELLTGFLFLFFFLENWDSFPSSLFYIVSLWCIWSLLVVIAVYDFHHHIIPNLLVYTFGIISFISIFLKCEGACSVSLVKNHVIAGGLLFSFFALLWLVSQGKWIGFGDAKLAIGIGLYLGLAQSLSAIAFAFWIGAGVGIALILYQRTLSFFQKKQLSSHDKTLTMKSALPFAPFLILGTFLSASLGSDIFGIHFFF